MSLKPYRWLAHYYDQLFTPFRSPIEAAHNKVLSPLLPQIKNACDLACGTGTTALTFARMGIAVYAIDLSPIMCRTVRQKATRAHLPITSLRADMRAFRLPEQVDLITCEYDALNHVPHRVDLRKVVKCVARSLRVGGYFYFDVNNSVGFKRYWLGTVWLEKPGVVSVMRNGHNHEAIGGGAILSGSFEKANTGYGTVRESKKSAGVVTKFGRHSAILALKKSVFFRPFVKHRTATLLLMSARADPCGWRSAMVVPTAAANHRNHYELRTPAKKTDAPE